MDDSIEVVEMITVKLVHGSIGNKNAMKFVSSEKDRNIEKAGKKICTKCGNIRSLKEFYRNSKICLRNGKEYLRATCKDCDKKHTKQWNLDNPERCAELRNKSVTKFYNNLRNKALIVLGNGEVKCKLCEFDDVRALQIDHVNGGGCVDRKRFSHSLQYLRYIIENSENYQILCANCNWIKRYENREMFKRYEEMF